MEAMQGCGWETTYFTDGSIKKTHCEEPHVLSNPGENPASC